MEQRYSKKPEYKIVILVEIVQYYSDKLPFLLVLYRL